MELICTISNHGLLTKGKTYTSIKTDTSKRNPTIPKYFVKCDDGRYYVLSDTHVRPLNEVRKEKIEKLLSDA
jgi:hypothetical protein